MTIANYKFSDPQEIVSSVLRAFTPPPDILPSEWAETYRRLSPESSASPGKLDMSRTEYFREPMDMVGRPGVRSVALMTSAQVGKSTLIENIIGFLMDTDPCPILHISPTLDSMKMFSKERLAPMIRDTPVLKGKVKEARARDSGNTINSKRFPGGHIAMVGSNAPAGLASRPIRALLADEVDRFDASAGTEGDPLKLGIKRTTTYWNRILIFVSTPGDKYDEKTDKGSRIEREFLAGDQRRRWCPCPHCGEYQTLKWANVQWDEGRSDTAAYICEHNGCVWDDNDRNKAVLEGEWRAEKPFNGRVSYHLSQLYSPFVMLSETVDEFLDSKGNPETLKTFVNTVLGEPWEPQASEDRVEWSILRDDHREDYNQYEGIPEDITLVTAAVDVQDNRFEIEFCGWGDDHRSWSLDYKTIYGDLSTPEPWEDLYDLLTSTAFVHPIFGEIGIRNTCIDSGGHYTQEVYNFCERHTRFQAIKGVDGDARPFVGKPLKNTIGNARVFPLGVHSIKETVVARLKQNDPTKGGYCRFPMSYDDDYFKMLTAEELRPKFKRGFKRKEWVKIRLRNEAFDLRVYNTAALEMLSLNLNMYRKRLLIDVHKRDTPKKAPKPKKPKSDWVSGWKNG